MSTPAGPGGDTADSPTYYDRPVLKEPVWIWSVPAYFHAGGTAAGAVAVGAAARLLSGDEHADLVTTCRRLAAAGNVAGTALLIHDLGRPARFLHMLRVFRPTSAMSMGSWSLAASTGLTVAAAVLPADGAGAARLGDVAGYGAAVLTPVQSTYTAVLLADTAVPLWRATDRRLPPLFAASALAGAGAAL